MEEKYELFATMLKELQAKGVLDGLVNAKGKAKAYQVRQVLRAIERLSNESNR